MQWVTEYDATNVAGTQPRKNMITMGKVDTWYQTAHLSLDSNVNIYAVYAVYDNSFALLMHDLIMADISDVRKGRTICSDIFILIIAHVNFYQSKCEWNNRLFRNPSASEAGWNMSEEMIY